MAGVNVVTFLSTDSCELSGVAGTNLTAGSTCIASGAGGAGAGGNGAGNSASDGAGDGAVNGAGDGAGDGDGDGDGGGAGTGAGAGVVGCAGIGERGEVPSSVAGGGRMAAGVGQYSRPGDSSRSVCSPRTASGAGAENCSDSPPRASGRGCREAVADRPKWLQTCWIIPDNS